MQNSTIIIKVGGSLLSRGEEDLFDFRYAYTLREAIKKLAESGYSIVLNVGGGYINRKYVEMLKSNGETDVEDLHLVGIALTNLNAQIIHGLLRDLPVRELISGKDFDSVVKREKRIELEPGRVVVFGAGKPGGSNDLNACQLAVSFDSTKVFDLKNVSGVFTEDPKKNPNAELLKDMTWDKYLEVIGNPTEHMPGAHYPVDPLAARLAKEKGIDFYILHGDNIDNVINAVRGLPYTGTLIH